MVSEKDMSLRRLVLPFVSAASVPVSFCCGGKTVRGIPEEFSPRINRIELNSSVVLTIVEGTDKNGLTIRAECTEYRDFPVSEWVAYLTNNGEEDTPVISDFRIIGTVFSGTEPTLLRSNGDYRKAQAYNLETEKIDRPIDIFPDPEQGLSCAGASPYMRLKFDSVSAFTNEPYFINMAIGWSGVWRAMFEPVGDGVSVFVSQYRFNTYIKPGETMRSPKVTLMACSGSDESRARNMWRRWYFEHILPRSDDGGRIGPMLCLHVFAENGDEFTGATEEQQVKGLEKYIVRGHKPDVWWIDAGWYKCHTWYDSVGSWSHDKKRFPNGLGPIGRVCNENGVKLLLWFEPERVSAGSELYREHFNWLYPSAKGSDYAFNLGNREACDWMISRVDSLIKQYGIKIYRQDFNFGIYPYWAENEAEDRVGSLENLHIQGYLRYWDTLRELNPGLIIDSCAGGGRRNDLDTMRRSVTLHYTDIGYGNHPIKQLQHRYMFEWIPYFRAHNMSWDNHDGTYQPVENREQDSFAFHCAMAPALTDMTNRNADDAQMELSVKMTAIWRRAAELMLTCDYYPLTECKADPSDWYAMQFDGCGKGFIQVVRNIAVKENEYTAFPHVEDKNAIYEFENGETGERFNATGRQLLEGLRVTLPERSGLILFYKRTDAGENS